MTYSPPFWFPDPDLRPMSTNDYTDKLSKLQHPAFTVGRLMWLPSSRMTVVPFEVHQDGMSCAVIDPGPNPEYQRSYPVGGYHLRVGNRELETAVDLSQYLFKFGRIPVWNWAIKHPSGRISIIDGDHTRLGLDNMRATAAQSGDELGLGLFNSDSWN